ncbi:MAG TPA: hypothetical protein VHI93_01355 [Candidatus Thermoplasmatota archaeon]|nr:hypothetical protein [Candidatus Thermoplasmatota archaeon]
MTWPPCPRCGRQTAGCGCVAIPAVVKRGDPLPALHTGQSGHACATCKAPALHEFSPHQYRACSAPCLRRASHGRFPLSEKAAVVAGVAWQNVVVPCGFDLVAAPPGGAV